MSVSRGYIAQEKGLSFLNRKAVLNLTLTFVYDDDAETAFDFPGYASAYFKIYDTGGEQLIKSFTTQVTRSENVLILNLSVSDMTFNDPGRYWFELGYLRTGGYEIPLRFGVLVVIA